MVIWDRLCELRMGADKREKLPSLKGVSKKRVEEELKITEEVASFIETDNITETNDFNIACAVVVTERLRIRLRRKNGDKQPRI